MSQIDHVNLFLSHPQIQQIGLKKNYCQNKSKLRERERERTSEAKRAIGLSKQRERNILRGCGDVGVAWVPFAFARSR